MRSSQHRAAQNFYPRPPRGGRRTTPLRSNTHSGFLSTPSARRATYVDAADNALKVFLSTPSARRATRLLLSVSWKVEFLSTPSARRATAPARASKLAACISIHALREEGDLAHGRSASRLPYFYPRPPRGGRLAVPGVGADPLRISIHALREEGDFAFSTISTMSSYFYPRPPRGGRRTAYKYSCGSFPFLSTPSARRATRFRSWALASRSNFYPRPPRGGRHLLLQHQHPERQISIHALREEGDCSDTVHHRCCRYFYPRPPRGGRPSVLKTGPRPILYFYPRPPRGGRLTWEIVAAACISISIHALREEGDPRRLRRCLLPCHFYPRPPRGGRPPSGA